MSAWADAVIEEMRGREPCEVCGHRRSSHLVVPGEHFTPIVKRCTECGCGGEA